MAHICHISTTFNLRWGGSRRVRSVLRAAGAAGHRVSLVVGHDHDVSAADLGDCELRVIPELVKHVSPRLDLRATRELRRTIQSLAPDLVHTHLAKAGILGRRAAHLEGVRKIAHTVHGPTFPARLPAPHQRLYRTLERHVSRYTDALVFVGEELRQEFIAAGVQGLSENVVIRTARSNEQLAFEPANEHTRSALRWELCGGTEPAFLIASVGRLVPAKGLHGAIQVIDDLLQGGVHAHLVLVGQALIPREQRHEAELRTVADELGLADRIHFAGYREDVLDVMHAADAALLTSRYEGLPNVAVEAALSGTPLVAYAVSGVREVTEGDPTARVVAPGDRAALVRALIELARNPPARGGATAHRARLVEQFSETRLLDETIALYRRLLGLRNDLSR